MKLESRHEGLEKGHFEGIQYYIHQPKSQKERGMFHIHILQDILGIQSIHKHHDEIEQSL